MNGEIPINPGDLPIDGINLEESVVYTGELRRATISPKLDRNGNVYCAVQLEVADGDYEGMNVAMNYLPIPNPISEDAPKRDRIKAHNQAVSFGRFCRAFKIDGAMPAVKAGDSESYNRWQDWVSQFYGRTGKFTVQNQEFPEGSGRMRSGVRDFVFDA